MAQNLIGVLSAGESTVDRRPQKNRILVSRYLHYSDAMFAERSHSRGFTSESRAMVSHAAILLKGFGMPSVGGIEGLTDHAREGDRLIVDGTNGVVIVRPSSSTVKKYRIKKEAAARPATMRVAGCMTADGSRIVLKANIENPDQVSLMVAHGLDGIGLFRTEFLISSTGHVPTEEAQYTTYRRVIAQAAGAPVTIRIFDIGGDKLMGLSDRCMGRNPALGLRGIRRHLTNRPGELRTQLRAILRAAVGARVGILIPMVTTVDDVIATKAHLDHVRDELDKAGLAFSPDTALGAMIETPAAAATVHDILEQVDFISVGTNDLLQYFMAADRDNESVLHYQDAACPAFLWLLDLIIRHARESGRETGVTICGDISSDPHILPHLLRMGYRSFSISPASAGMFRAACAGFRQTPAGRGRQARIR